MKKFLIAFTVLVCSISVKAQFSNTDTLRSFINRWIRNSAVEAFQNLRLNTALIGMTNFVDSAYGGQVVSFVATNDTTLRIITVGGDTLIAYAKGRNLNLQQVCTNGSTFTTNFTITLQDSLKITSGYVVIDSLRLPALTNRVDTTTYKPLSIDASGNVSKMVGWPIPPSIDTTNKWVNDIRRSNDSVYIFKNGSWQFKYIDSTGGGGINQLTGDVTAGPGTGSQAATIATNAVTTTKIADNNVTNAKVAAFRTYAPERTWGTIYEKSSWTSTSDFLPIGTANVALSGGYINITSATTGDYTADVRILPARPTGFNRWKMTIRYKITAWAANSNWFGPGIKSLVTHSGANFGFFGFTAVNNSGTGNSYFINESGSILAGGSAGPSKSLNDVMESTIELNDTVFTYTIRNVTTSSSTQTVTYTFPSNQSVILPNVGNWALMYNSSTSGTIQLQYLKIETAETINPNVLINGNSKVKVGYSGAWVKRFPIQLNAYYPTVAYSAGSAEYTTDALLKIDEMTQYNPEYVIIADHPANDMREGATLQQCMDRLKILYDAFASGGSKVYIMPLPEDSVGANAGLDGLTGLKGAIFATYPNNVINAWDSLSTNNVLKSIYNSGDNVHLNQAAMDKIVEAIVAAGKISTIGTQRRTPYRATDGLVKAIGDSLAFRYKIAPIKNVLPKFDANYDIVGSTVHDDGTNVVVSTTRNPTVPSGSILFNVNGASATYGSLSTMRVYDRSTTSEYMELYKNGDFRFANHSAQVGAIDNTGRWTIGYDANRQTAVGEFRILGGYSHAVGTLLDNGAALNIDSAQFTASTNTNYGNGAYVSIGRGNHLGTTGTVYNNYSTLLIKGPQHAGTGMTFTNSWALNVDTGNVRLGSIDSVGTATGGYLFRDATTGQVKQSHAIASINSQNGPDITISGDATNGITVSASTNTVTIAGNTDLESFNSDANNTGTGETDLYSSTIAANKLTLNGKGLRFRITGTNNDATATAQIKGYFAGTNIFDSGALTMSAAGDWVIDMEIQRTTSTTAAATVTFSCANTTVTLPVKYTALTSQDWTTTNIFKVTGTAGGGGGGSNDITAHAGKVIFVP